MVDKYSYLPHGVQDRGFDSWGTNKLILTKSIKQDLLAVVLDSVFIVIQGFKTDPYLQL